MLLSEDIKWPYTIYFPFTCSLKFSIVYKKMTLQPHWVWYHQPISCISTWKRMSRTHFWVILYRFDFSSSLRSNTRYDKATFCMVFLNLKLKILIKIHNRKGGIGSASCINNFLFAIRTSTSEIWGCTASKQQPSHNSADCKCLPWLTCSPQLC